VLARPSEQGLELGREDRRRIGLDPPLGVERFEQRESNHLLDFEVALGLRAGADQPPAVVAVLLVADVVARPALGIGQD
jgi:hypothetical protein